LQELCGFATQSDLREQKLLWKHPGQRLEALEVEKW